MACAVTTPFASAALVARMVSAPGTARMRPACMRFMFSPLKASGLARYRATSIMSSDTPDGFSSLAMRLSVSPVLTLYSLAAFFAAAGAASVAAAAAAAALALPGSTGAATCAPRVWRASGVSSTNAYSRTWRPLLLLSSSSRSTIGSATGCAELIRMKGLPLRFSTANVRAFRAGLNSTLAWRYASGGASLASRLAASPGLMADNSTSARSGWPAADSTVILPSSAAYAAGDNNTAQATALLSVLMAREATRGRVCTGIVGGILVDMGKLLLFQRYQHIIMPRAMQAPHG
ncbi:hypothetical protein JaAD80_15465 [Janthinobacterium sp. AD80]|nr:hypothetical protein JaAD80_15465 [Janthinobacterium sp. AD80]